MRSAPPPMARDCRLMSLDVGANEPDIRWNSVDLPAPLGPMTAWRSPARTARFTPRMICASPKDLRTSVR